MFFIDLATGDIVNASGEKLLQTIHFTGFQLEKFEFSFLSGTEQYILPENCEIFILGDIAEHFSTPMFAAYGKIAADRKSAIFQIDTATGEYIQRVKASNTPCFVDVCIQKQAEEFSKRLIRFNAVADCRLTLNAQVPEPLEKYYTREEIHNLLQTWQLDFSAGEITAAMLEYGEQPYAGLTVNKADNQYKLDFTIAIPSGKPGNNGYTPQRSIDYWTTDDVNTINQYINDRIDTVILEGTY